MNEVILGNHINISDLVNVARYHFPVSFSDEYGTRVEKARKAVEKLRHEGRKIYGVTTGLGDNSNIILSKDDTREIQNNILRSHATAMGEPLNKECVRSIMFTMLQAFGQGYSGISIETLDLLRRLLNEDITPYCPSHGSVGYLSVEANIGLVLIGEGRAYVNQKLMSGSEALKMIKCSPLRLKSKEGLTLVSGTTSITGIGSLTIFDAMTLAETTDISGAMSFEVLKGNLMAMDSRLMAVKPYKTQSEVAAKVVDLLSDSEILKEHGGSQLQDALSLRCIPQVHGAVKKSLLEAFETFEIELNSSTDNPQIFVDEQEEVDVVMGCNPDGTFIGLAADSIAVAITTLSKITERRIDRLLNRHVSGLSPFLIHKLGQNSGLMIMQYSAAGILGEMRVLAHPASVDNVTTSALQEDYVSMAYNAVMKGYKSVNLAMHISAIELFCAAQAQDFYTTLKSSTVTNRVYKLIREKALYVSKDRVMYNEVEEIVDLIKSQAIVSCLNK